jgi:hypothetical protein
MKRLFAFKEIYVLATLALTTASVVGSPQFYRPSDKFPKQIKGIYLIGNFVATNPVGDTVVLSADRTRGEKFNQRYFTPVNFGIRNGQQFTFTKEQPLIVQGKDFSLNFGMGAYNVALAPQQASPTSIASEGHDTAGQGLQVNSKAHAAPNAIATLKNSDDFYDRLRANSIDPVFYSLFNQLNSPSLMAERKRKFTTQVAPLNGLGNIPWGSSFEDVALGGNIQPGGVTLIRNYNWLYRAVDSTNKSPLEKATQHTLINDQHDSFMAAEEPDKTITGLQRLPNFGLVMGDSNDGTVQYFFSDDQLYAVIISPKEQRLTESDSLAGRQANTIQVYTAALSSKYGTPTVEGKTVSVPLLGEMSVITQTWRNSNGTVVMTLLPINRITADIGRVALAFAEIYAGSYVDTSAVGGTIIGEGAKQLLGGAAESAKDWLSDFEKQYSLSNITYYSNAIMGEAEARRSRYEAKKVRDRDILAQTKNKEINKRAAEIRDGL